MDHTLARTRFGARLRMLRTERGLTQEALAELVGKTTEHISFMERGERSPSFELLIDLADALDMPLSQLMNVDNLPMSANLLENLAVAPVSHPLPAPVPDSATTPSQRLSDIERLNAAFEGIYETQRLADEYGIGDILQDNGGKVLQLLILLGLRISPGREGNDALDAEGHEYELKTVNGLLRQTPSITTHHHLNHDILRKYRAVKAWYIAIYDGVRLREIYKVSPRLLEPLFQTWEAKLTHIASLNNPKIPMRYVLQGERVYPPGAPVQLRADYMGDVE